MGLVMCFQGFRPLGLRQVCLMTAVQAPCPVSSVPQPPFATTLATEHLKYLRATFGTNSKPF